MINQNQQSSYPQRKPLGLAFWQGGVGAKRQPCQNIPANGNPLGLVFQLLRI